MAIEIKQISDLKKQGIPLDEIGLLCDKIYGITDFICEDYPKHKSWFYKKHLPEVLTEGSGRDIIYAQDQNTQKIVGTVFTKKDETEKKICTLYVDESRRGERIATKLIERSFEILDTTKPMITIADYKLPMFEGIINKYGWEHTQTVNGLYNDKYSELVYNGQLPEN